MSPANDVVAGAFARGLEPDPNMMVDEWSDQFMIIPKDSGANEYGKYRTSRTPHARMVMRALSDNHPCKRVALMGASQMLKTQVGLNWFSASVHQSPANFLWILPTGKLAKRTSTRISKTIAAVPELAERVAAPRSRDSVNTIDTKEYIGGSLFVVTAGAAANLSEVPARRVLFDEVDRAEANVNGEGDPVALAEARQTTFERNRKAYYPSSPTVAGESIIEKLYLRGTQHEALADCVHCDHAQTLVFERLQLSEDGQNAMYPCIECGAFMFEADKNRMFARGAWSDGVAGDGETVSFTISGMFLPYGWVPWLALLREYAAAKAKLDEGSEESMIAFYNTRLARCWERAKEQTKHDELMARAEDYKLGRVPAGGLKLTAAIDTQNDRLEMKVVAWGEGMECWIIDYQIIHQSPAEEATWERADELLKTRYRHAHGEMMAIDAAFIDSGGNHTQDVYNYTYTRRRRAIFAIKGESRPNRPILASKPTIIDINWRGKTEKRGGQLWFIGTDTAKDYLASRWKRGSGAGAVHFSHDLPEDYYKQLTAEYRINVYRRGRKVSAWEKPAAARNEALDLMVYNLGAAYYLGLHKKTEGYWQGVREKLNPANRDMFANEPQPDEQVASGMVPPLSGESVPEQAQEKTVGVQVTLPPVKKSMASRLARM
ncbi:phage terminase large subunit family protein [Janthinobacterium sp.]|uniref:phage terminase large subunit family protein n=1 Tax=Janthinobacterium sp. TaxID=1871054 RepID=UPI00293D4544|nr:phage terminase large subunit family protein [Janthinobacterium sp.]